MNVELLFLKMQKISIKQPYTITDVVILVTVNNKYFYFAFLVVSRSILHPALSECNDLYVIALAFVAFTLH
jgi:hypothetical protein